MKIGALVFVILFMNLVSAELIVTQPNSVYNFGDSLNLKATVRVSETTNGFLQLNLVCNSIDSNFYRVPLALDKEKSVEVSLLLTPEITSGGSCIIRTSYASQTSESQVFEISDRLSVFVASNDIIAESGKSFIVSGSALRANSGKANGGVEVSVENGSVKSAGMLDNGRFSVNFTMPESARSGKYSLRIFAYEKYSEKIINYGEAEMSVYVKQTPKNLVIYLGNQSINPDERVVVRPVIIDQAGERVGGKIAVKIFNPEDILVIEDVVDSDEFASFRINSSSMPGNWILKANSLNLTAENQIYIKEFEKARFEVVNESLTITNTGNVAYKKSVQIAIGDYSEVKTLDLGVGEETRLRLNGPSGEHPITVSDGSSSLSTKSFLTGGAIGVSEFASAGRLKYYTVYIFLVLILGLFVVNIVRKSMVRRVPVMPRESATEKGSGVIKLNVVDEAEHLVVGDGRKEQASLVVIKFRSVNNEILGKAREIIKRNKGAVYHSDDFLIGIFSSPTTKTFDNEMIAVRTADSIEREIKGRAEYGIGVHNGELIVKKGEKLRFTSLGSTLPLGKKIAELSINELLLSESVNSRVMNQVKTIRKEMEGLKLYNIKEIANREKYSKFISDFVNRQKR